MKGFGTRLRALREKRGLSQQELADIIGIHLSQLSRLEREASFPTAETVLSLARALHATTDALLLGDRSGEERIKLHNVRLFERFRALDSAARDEQETAIKLIDALLAKRRMEEALGRRRG
jgi:transcriptional regulator with XRE-family HTH domain